MQFGPHGSIDVQAEFPLLIMTAEGPWNRELIDQWTDLLLPHAEAFVARGPWVGIGVMRRSMLCTDDAIERHREIARLMVDAYRGIGAAHVAGPEVEGEAMMRNVFETMFEGVCPYAHFHHLDEARRWSRRLLDSQADPKAR